MGRSTSAPLPRALPARGLGPFLRRVLARGGGWLVYGAQPGGPTLVPALLPGPKPKRVVGIGFGGDELFPVAPENGAAVHAAPVGEVGAIDAPA